MRYEKRKLKTRESLREGEKRERKWRCKGRVLLASF